MAVVVVVGGITLTSLLSAAGGVSGTLGVVHTLLVVTDTAVTLNTGIQTWGNDNVTVVHIFTAN